MPLPRDCRALLDEVSAHNARALGRAITLAEEGGDRAGELLCALEELPLPEAATIGLTGTGGAGKSTLAARLIDHFRASSRRVGLIAVDPSSPLSGGAVLGDRVRMMRHACDKHVAIRSMASRGRLGGLSAATASAARLMKLFGCDPVIIETVGVGQAEFDIVRLADLTALVLAPGLGDDIQAMKAGLIEMADLLVINKGDLPGAEALRRDLDPIARDRGRALLKVSARDGMGIDDMTATLDALFCQASQSGALADKRRRASDAETLDWALELLRHRLEPIVGTQGKALRDKDPRVRAQMAIQDCFLSL